MDSPAAQEQSKNFLRRVLAGCFSRQLAESDADASTQRRPRRCQSSISRTAQLHDRTALSQQAAPTCTISEPQVKLTWNPNPLAITAEHAWDSGRLQLEEERGLLRSRTDIIEVQDLQMDAKPQHMPSTSFCMRPRSPRQLPVAAPLPLPAAAARFVPHALPFQLSMKLKPACADGKAQCTASPTSPLQLDFAMDEAPTELLPTNTGPGVNAAVLTLDPEPKKTAHKPPNLDHAAVLTRIEECPAAGQASSPGTHRPPPWHPIGQVNDLDAGPSQRFGAGSPVHVPIKVHVQGAARGAAAAAAGGRAAGPRAADATDASPPRYAVALVSARPAGAGEAKAAAHAAPDGNAAAAADAGSSDQHQPLLTNGGSNFTGDLSLSLRPRQQSFPAPGLARRASTECPVLLIRPYEARDRMLAANLSSRRAAFRSPHQRSPRCQSQNSKYPWQLFGGGGGGSAGPEAGPHSGPVRMHRVTDTDVHPSTSSIHALSMRSAQPSPLISANGYATSAVIRSGRDERCNDHSRNPMVGFLHETIEETALYNVRGTDRNSDCSVGSVCL